MLSLALLLLVLTLADVVAADVCAYVLAPAQAYVLAADLVLSPAIVHAFALGLSLAIFS